ncbi:MAG: DGQHR domain-containing protein [Streptosporangiaceae bacterium]
MKLTGIREIEVEAHQARNLDTICYRGTAPLAQLALISQADVFDQIANPDGLQRDLSPKHASDAYDYAEASKDPDFPRAYPEVVLNVRDKKVLGLEDIGTLGSTKLFRLSFDLDKMRDGKVAVSRVDGNHRLFYAAGDDRRDPLMDFAPFQIHVGLSREQERSLFVDINANQKGLNTSHLAIMRARLTPEEQEIKDHADRWIANRLADDVDSPWHGLVHLGGSKRGSRTQGLSRPVNFASLQAGVGRTLGKSQYIHDLTNPEAQYLVIRNYWEAVKRTFADEWARPKDYLLLKNIGVMSMSILGGTIIDRCMARGTASIEGMARYLRQAKTTFDWNKDATGERSVSGMSGNRAALIIAGEMAKELSDETGANAIKDLQEELLAQTPS